MNNLRLQMIANYIETEDCLADIGCDHGYLGIIALNKGVKVIQLIDNKKGPLDSAMHNLKKYQSTDNNIIFTLSSGLDHLSENVNTIVMAGMGGHLIIKLLNENLIKAKKLNKIIIQANSEISNVRKFLDDNRFKIINESIVCDKHKFYEIIVCKYDNEYKTRLSEDEIYFGPFLLIDCSETFLDKWKEQVIKLENIKNVQNKDIISINNKINYIKNTLKI